MERLSITLRYLVTGNTFEDLKFISAIAPHTIGKVVIETYEAIISYLHEYIKVKSFLSKMTALYSLTIFIIYLP